jgi:AcrR family transcriptional regulator
MSLCDRAIAVFDGPLPATNRKSGILDAATQNFARYGFRGASLRTIARESGVSLTLLNHHFGSKQDLLSAVVVAHQPMMVERLEALRRALAGPAASLSLLRIIEPWVSVGFDAIKHKDNLAFLLLLSRVMARPDEEGLHAARQALEDEGQLFIEGFMACVPGASRRAAACGYIYVDATLTHFLLSAKELFRAHDVDDALSSNLDDRARLVSCLVAGVGAGLSTLSDGRLDIVYR